MRRYVKKGMVIISALIMLLGFSANTKAKEAVKVAAVLTNSGLGDNSTNDAINAGLLRAQEELGASVQIIETQELAEYVNHFAELSRSGEYDLIIGCTYEQSEAMMTVAEAFPDQKFLLIDCTVENDTNITSIAFANNERSFLVGAIAGMMTETDKVGIVGGQDVSFIHNCVAGYMSGVKYTNPDAEVSVKYTNNWSDTTLAKEIAIAMNDADVDIIYNQCGSAGLGIYSAAEECGFYAIGTETNQNGLSPDHIMCSALSLMGETAYQGVKDLMDGALVPGAEIRGFAKGGIGYTTEESNVVIPQEVIDMAEASIEKISAGEIVVPETLEEADAFSDTYEK